MIKITSKKNTATTTTTNAKPSVPAKPGVAKPAAAKPAVIVPPVKADKPKPVAVPPKAAKPEGDPGISLKELASLIVELGARMSQYEQKLEAVTKAKAEAKAKPVNVRKREEIIEGVKLDENDWRSSYHGHEISVYQMDRDKTGDLLVHDDRPVVAGLLALPRDNDVGNEGAAARVSGSIAVHWQRLENGEYLGMPAYLSQEELAAVWAESE